MIIISSIVYVKEKLLLYCLKKKSKFKLVDET